MIVVDDGKEHKYSTLSHNIYVKEKDKFVTDKILKAYANGKLVYPIEPYGRYIIKYGGKIDVYYYNIHSIMPDFFGKQFEYINDGLYHIKARFVSVYHSPNPFTVSDSIIPKIDNLDDSTVWFRTGAKYSPPYAQYGYDWNWFTPYVNAPEQNTKLIYNVDPMYHETLVQVEEISGLNAYSLEYTGRDGAWHPPGIGGIGLDSGSRVEPIAGNIDQSMQNIIGKCRCVSMGQDRNSWVDAKLYKTISLDELGGNKILAMVVNDPEASVPSSYDRTINTRALILIGYVMQTSDDTHRYALVSGTREGAPYSRIFDYGGTLQFSICNIPITKIFYNKIFDAETDDPTILFPKKEELYLL